MSTENIFQAVEDCRKRLGPRVCIMGHHYQSEEVIRHTDLRGDSLELARKAAQVNAEHIVFCGVYFMADSAALLARPGQTVHLPEPSADCSMALMSKGPAVDSVLTALEASGKKIVPLAYVNSTMDVKAVVGRRGGSVCTSANAEVMMRWAFDQGDAVLFLPDRNLGLNTAPKLGISPLECLVLDVKKGGSLVESSAAEQARLLLWPGFCSIHTRFSTRQIERLRAEYPGIKAAVHPECTPEVVAAADAAGSTSFLIRYADNAPDGSFLAVGTELNLVERLARKHKGRITVMPLVESECTHMAQTTEERLLAALRAVEAGSKEFAVTAPAELAEDAKVALERMLDVCGR